MKGKTTANSLPEDVWLKIFETGIVESNLGCSDLSSLSISCKRFNALSKQDMLWSSLLSPPTPPPRTHSSFLRSLYKCRLEKDLQRIRASILLEIASVEHQLSLFAQRIQMIQRLVVRSDPIQEFAAQIVKVGKRRFCQTNHLISFGTSPISYHQHFKELYGRVILINEQVKELSDALLDMIMFREYTGKRSAVICQAPLPFAASSQLDADIILLETEADSLVSHQHKYLEYLLVEQCKIEALLIRHKENTKQLERLTSRLSSFSACQLGSTEAEP